MAGSAWTECVFHPQAASDAKAGGVRCPAVVPAVHRVTAETTIFLFPKDRAAPVPETVDQ